MPWLGNPTLARGWAIPCATDIAFSFLVAVAIFGRSHPALPFLLLLAIADDALGLVILAVFYPVARVRPLIVLGLVGLTIAVVMLMKRRRVTGFWPYVLMGGSLAWAGLFLGGLHPALALVPVVPFLPRAARDAGPLVEEPHKHDALNEFEHWWKRPVQLILFAFGLVNAGVPVAGMGAATWAVLGAIIAGKPLGIGLAVAAAIAAGFHLPARMTWRDVDRRRRDGRHRFHGRVVLLDGCVSAGPDAGRGQTGRALEHRGRGRRVCRGGSAATGRFRASRAERP